MAKTGRRPTVTRPSRPTGKSTGKTGASQGMSFEDKFNMVLRAGECIGDIIKTVSEERRKYIELEVEGKIGLKKIDEQIKHYEEDTKRIIAQLEHEGTLARIEADTERERIIAQREGRRLSHEKDMEMIRNQHEKEMRALEIIAQLMTNAMAVYDNYRVQEFADIISVDTLEKMNGTIMMLSEALSHVGVAEQQTALEADEGK